MRLLIDWTFSDTNIFPYKTEHLKKKKKSALQEIRVFKQKV